MGPRRAVVLTAALALALPACGGDDEGGGGSDATRGGETAVASALAQDRRAKAHARNLATAVETCFVDRQDYSLCKRVDGWEATGDAQVERASASEYTLVAPSASGNEFRIERSAEGTTSRECSVAGRAGCPPGGRW